MCQGCEPKQRSVGVIASSLVLRELQLGSPCSPAGRAVCIRHRLLLSNIWAGGWIASGTPQYEEGGSHCPRPFTALPHPSGASIGL